MKILVTGAGGFIGQNLLAALAERPDVEVLSFESEDSLSTLDAQLAQADFIFHLAGVNRPQREDEFWTGNAGLTAHLCDRLLAGGRACPLVLSSSTQSALDNAYGRSKRQAEELVASYGEASGAPVQIYRLTNVFGKWSRPQYNSVVATFCHNIARDLPITVSDPNHVLELIHIDDVVAHFLADLDGEHASGPMYRKVKPSYQMTLGGLADTIHNFRRMRETLVVPDLGDAFTHKLYGTYLAYLETDDFAYNLVKRTDERGSLAEFVKSTTFGQIFVSRTAPGVTRGNHYHNTKTEKFLVVEGEAVVRFRHIVTGEVLEYTVRGDEFRVVDIPTGYTHSIENVGSDELVTLFWASEIFDPARTDTYYQPVLHPQQLQESR